MEIERWKSLKYTAVRILFWEYLPNQLWIITFRRFLLDKDVFIRRSELANSFGREFSAIRAMVRWNRQLKRKLWNGKFPEHQSLWWSKLFITLDTCLWFVLLNSFYSKPTDWAKIYYYYYYYYYTQSEKNIASHSHILSIITRLRTGHGSSKEWFERFHIPQDSQECECGELKTLRHILIECVWYDDLRQKLKRVSPALDLSVLLNTKQGLQAIVSFWKLRDENLSSSSHCC